MDFAIVMKCNKYVESKLIREEFELLLNFLNSETQFKSTDLLPLFCSTRDLKAIDNLFLFINRNREKKGTMEKLLERDKPFYTFQPDKSPDKQHCTGELRADISLISPRQSPA